MAKNKIFNVVTSTDGDYKLPLRSACESVWLFVSVWPCNRPENHPRCTPPLPKGIWDRLQQPHRLDQKRACLESILLFFFFLLIILSQGFRNSAKSFLRNEGNTWKVILSLIYNERKDYKIYSGHKACFFSFFRSNILCCWHIHLC